MPSNGTQPQVLAAIDVGTNAARLKLAHLYPDGRLVPFLKKRAPIRPGEGVFADGEMPPHVVARLVATLRDFGDESRRHAAHLRAVATSSLRDARNAAQVQARVRADAGVELHVISGQEEARLICLGVLDGRPRHDVSLIVDIGGGSTEIVVASGEAPQQLWSLALGTVRLTETFGSARRVDADGLAALRDAARGVVSEALAGLRGAALPRMAFGTSGTIKALARYPGKGRSNRIDCARLPAAVQALAAMKLSARQRLFRPGRADIIVAGAVILEAVAGQLALDAVLAVEPGLRDGLLVALARELRAAAPPTAEPPRSETA